MFWDKSNLQVMEVKNTSVFACLFARLRILCSKRTEHFISLKSNITMKTQQWPQGEGSANEDMQNK